MPRGKVLTETERVKAATMKNLGCSMRAIAKEIGRSLNVIRNFFKLGEKYAARKHPKGNKKVGNRLITQIKDEATKNKLSPAEIVSKLNLPIKKRRVQQILQADINLKYKKPAKAPHLTQCHKTARLDFARKHMKWEDEWKTVIFSDEKKFNLDGPDGFSCYWHDLRKDNPPRMSRNFGGGSLMIWGAFSYHGKLRLGIVPTKMNSDIYTDLLEVILVPYLDEKNNIDFIFQQDNAAVHASRFTKSYLDSKNIKIMEWPSRSPDINPIENLWGILSRRVYANGRQFSSVAELKKKILECWGEIDDNVLKTLINSMPNRIFQIIRNNGAKTKY